MVQKKEIKSIPVLFDAILGNAGNRKIDAAGLGGFDGEYGDDGWFEQPEAAWFEMVQCLDFLRGGGAQDAIVAIGENAISEIESSAKLSSDQNAALLAKLLTTRIKEPEQYAKFRAAIDKPAPNSGTHGGPREEDLQRAAFDLANAITPKNAWVLEAELAFSGWDLYGMRSFGMRRMLDISTSIEGRALQILKTQQFDRPIR